MADEQKDEAKKPGPATFRDNAGRLWAVVINPRVIARVQTLTGIDLGRVEKDRYAGVAEAVSHVVTFCNVLYAICKPEADRLGITDEQFGEALVGDAVEEAGVAFQRAFAFFSPSRVRGTLLDLADKGTEYAQKAAALAAQRVKAIDVDAMIAALSKTATPSPDSSGSIPAS